MSSPPRPAAVAGTFYPASPSSLGRLVDELLADATGAPRMADDRLAGMPKALIVPHAGYVYSGPIAASAFALLARDPNRIERVVLIGPAHRVLVRGVVAAGASSFETPLGVIEVDEGALEGLAGVSVDRAAHAREHSLEVELPFLQRLLPRARLVALAAGHARGEEVGSVLEALWGGPETLVVVSSDLSHYLPYAQAQAIDEATAARIVALDPRPIAPDEACGSTGINGLVEVAVRRRLRPVLLDLRNSGDTAGERSEVVGYGAFAFYEGGAEGGRDGGDGRSVRA